VIFHSNPGLASYAKTTAFCTALVGAALLLGLFGSHWSPKAPAPFLVALGMLVALGAATLASAGVVVLIRCRRSALGEQDLFLELNRCREPAAIKAAGPSDLTRARRWLARRLLGHDLLVGDLVEVKRWSEIRATLDETGCLEQLPFMPEMLPMCGRRAYVFRGMHRLFDYRKSRRMRHLNDAVLLVETVCDGSSHGACDAGCHAIWKSAWLRRLEPKADSAGSSESSRADESCDEAAVLQFGTRAPRYACQLTQLHAASQPIQNWSAANFLRPLVAGNVAPAAFIVGWLTYIFNDFQHIRQGVSFPTFEAEIQGRGGLEETRLEAGDQVLIRSSAEIRATLNDQLEHRGLGFEPDMLKHCGRRSCVQGEVRRVIDIVTGEMRTMKTPAYVLRNIHFSGERQLFNAQYEPLFWRAIWLRREGAQSQAICSKSSRS
jgi:hypothetical protein